MSHDPSRNPPPSGVGRFKLADLKAGMGDRAKVNAWLDSIGETDEACRNEILNACANGYTNSADGIFYTGKEVRAYFVSRYNEIGQPA